MATIGLDQHVTDLDRGTREVRLTIPAKPEYITLGEETLGDLKLALTEACSNSVRHAYAGGEGTVEIRYVLHSNRLEIEVADDGEGFDPSAEREEGDDLVEGGLGIAIIRSIADELEIGAGKGGKGSRLRFAKSLDD
jgi:serine/threonine-protein kinase RsbW